MAKKILDVPRVKQLPNHCGPACLEMVLRYFGYDINQKQIAEYWVYEPVIEGGISFEEITPYVENYGFVSILDKNMTLEKVINSINEELPVIARINDNSSTHHVVVIRGYEKNWNQPSILWINDPGELSEKRILYENFTRRWNYRGKLDLGKWGIVIQKK